MDDLAAWLTQIWDEGEAAAEGNGIIAWLTYRNEDGSMRYTSVASGLPEIDHWVSDGQEAEGYASARVVYDYRAVLARIEADRGLLAEALKYQPGQPGYGMARQAMKFLAAGHADRPGYREEWKP